MIFACPEKAVILQLGAFRMEPVLTQEVMDAVLFDALRAIYQFERGKVEAHDLDYGAIYLLQFLRRNQKAQVSRIAAEMRLPVSTVSRMAARLEKRGLLSRKEDAGDRRRVLVSLNPEGEELVRQVEAHSADLILKNLADFPAGAVETLLEAALLLPDALKIADGELK